MAIGTSDRSTGTETCQAPASENGDRQLSLPMLGPRSSSQIDHSISAYARNETGHVVNQRVLLSNRPNPATTEQLDFGLQSLNVRDQNHDSVLGRNEATAMVESPAGSLLRPPSPEAKTPNRPREVTYASSVAGSSNRETRPPRQDSAYFSARGLEDNGSEVDFDAQARQLRARERIIIRRERVRRTRRLFRNCRDKVQAYRDAVRDAVDKLTRNINEQRALNLDVRESIDPYYDKLRIAQDQLGPAEDEYDALERRLDEEEDDFEEEEDHFYRHYDLFNISVPEADIDAPLSPLAEPCQPTGSEPAEIMLENSLVREYLDKMEEAERLKDDVEDLENEYLQVSGEATFRRRHDLPLSEDSSKFLLDYPKLHAEALNDLHDAEDALFDTRDKCIEQGVFTESEYAYEPRDALRDEVMDYVFDAEDRSSIRNAVHHLHYNEKSTDFGDKKDYVNKWLLQWVEESAVGALLLRAFIYFEYPDDTNKLGEEKWSELAVQNWDKDQAGDSANKNNRESRLDTIAGIDPGAVGKKHATSTARSGFSSSFGTLEVEVVADDEALTSRSESVATRSTQHAKSPTTPKRQIFSSTDSQHNDSTPIAASQAQGTGSNSFELVIHAAPIQPDISFGNVNFSASFQSINSIATSGGALSPHTSCTDTATFSTENDDSRLDAAPVDNSKDSTCKGSNSSAIQEGIATIHPSNVCLPDIEKSETHVLAPSLLEESQTFHPSRQNDTTSTPKARPILDNTENINMATLNLYETAMNETPKAPATNLEAVELDPPPLLSTHNDFSSTEHLSTDSNTDTNLNPPLPSPSTPILTIPPDPPDLSKHQRAKSDDIIPALRTSSDPVRSQRFLDSLQVSTDTQKKRRRSVSPTSFMFVASHTLRKMSSFSTLPHHVDAESPI
ncbi:uncharacterized protein LY89DRAFT_691932 [Mollisia scopiformis]|uniref:Uncharacterized protein n=1 Tax=Mollisia scopiformis TaxID=149040 RepID=A0A132B412_MOLSC|nr:uncharacterized protein LY89DRAFT_691932 [Mollisia scopiformis]KUJ07130.1 hypothetical protein LY89DRAFT_691932 [Mollisia scopiformis]